MGDGLLGLSPNLGTNKMTFAQHLKKRGLIKSDSFSIEFNITESINTKG